MTIAPEELFWQLAADLQREDPRIQESTIMNGRCLRVGKEFLALVDYKGSGLVVKLPPFASACMEAKPCLRTVRRRMR